MKTSVRKPRFVPWAAMVTTWDEGRNDHVVLPSFAKKTALERNIKSMVIMIYNGSLLHVLSLDN